MSTDTMAPVSARPAMDPRMAARRVEIAQRQRRLRRHRLMAILVFVTLSVAAGVSVRSPLLDVDTVAITGDGRTGAALARRTAGIARRRAMVSVDLAAAEARLERLPWVADAQVGRRWPGTVTVALVERRPAAAITTSTGALGVDRDGRALGPVGSGFGDHALPVLAGPGLPVGSRLEADRRAVVATVAALPAELRREVVAASADPSGVLFTLAEGVTVRWGDRRLARAKAEALRTILRQPGRDGIAIIDVTVPSAAAVTAKTAPGR